MCHKLDPMFFKELGAMNPKDVCERSLASYDSARNAYRITAICCEYEVSPAAFEIKPVDPDEAPVSVELGLMILFYLMRAKATPLSGKWAGEFDLKGGERFFRGPHAMRNDEVAKTFGKDLDGFKSVCEKIGGVPAEMGDAAFRFQVLPRVPVIVIFWKADDEFEASAKLLMDSSISEHLPLDVIFGMALELLGKIVGKALWH